ncbi:hypothetical protein [Acinetobacter venetianus]|uniref:Uncharacterized protein n=1 Tax=Acinetobacter venetianus TaxID=52133 RepID=A0A150HYC0_9GAMM|nr:hypothetical protein [Acinetobacter venetianus]KXZ72155.1 hypothetical protein AVENLUH13518_00766 [Acinetobacter venetianus]
MACKSCEERREWMVKQIERARERTAAAINRIRGIADKDSGAEHNTDSADSEQGSDNLGSAGTEQRTPVATKRAGRGKTKVENVGLSEVNKDG